MGVQSLSHWPASGSSELSIFPQAGSHPEGTGPDPRLLPPKPVNLCSCLSSAQTILAQAASRVSLGPSPASSAIQPPTFPKGLSPTPVLLVLPRPAHPLLPRFSSSVNVQLPVVPCDGSFRALVPGVHWQEHTAAGQISRVVPSASWLIRDGDFPLEGARERTGAGLPGNIPGSLIFKLRSMKGCRNHPLRFTIMSSFDLYNNPER